MRHNMLQLATGQAKPPDTFTLPGIKQVHEKLPACFADLIQIDQP